ncbi:hypothetical protein J1614_006412 [Plenodomus biglobosus]|nr:hypothetical protein J1614_006412 [Plenodomus biglobosus]
MLYSTLPTNDVHVWRNMGHMLVLGLLTTGESSSSPNPAQCPNLIADAPFHIQRCWHCRSAEDANPMHRAIRTTEAKPKARQRGE